MKRRRRIKPDRILEAVETYWSLRSKLIRTLARWDGTVTANELIEVLAETDHPQERNRVQQALGRLVHEGIAIRTVMPRTTWITGTALAKFQYVINPNVSVKAAINRKAKRPPKYRCGKCGRTGHTTPTHAHAA